MHVAAYYAHKDTVAVLLSPSYGADVELANKDGWTALHAASAQVAVARSCLALLFSFFFLFYVLLFTLAPC